MAHQVWGNPAIVEELKRLWVLPEKTAAQIATILSETFGCEVGKDSVIGKACRLKLGAKPPRPVPRKKIMLTAKPIEKAASSGGKPSNSITILALGNNMCRWPIGDPQAPGFHFCGERAVDGKPYCQKHTEIAFVPVKYYARKSIREPLIAAD